MTQLLSAAKLHVSRLKAWTLCNNRISVSSNSLTSRSHHTLTFIDISQRTSLRGQHPSYARCKSSINQFNIVHSTGPMMIMNDIWACFQWLQQAVHFFEWFISLIKAVEQLWTMQSVSKFKKRRFWPLAFHILSWLTVDWAHAAQHSAPTTHSRHCKSSVLNVYPGFLPMTPFNKQWRNVCNSGNSGTVSGSQLFAQL